MRSMRGPYQRLDLRYPNISEFNAMFAVDSEDSSESPWFKNPHSSYFVKYCPDSVKTKILSINLEFLAVVHTAAMVAYRVI
jgi:hypothetical protein